MRSEPHIERWMDALDSDDHVVTCAIVRGEVLFGIAKLPQGQRRSELEATAFAFLSAFVANRSRNVLVTTMQR